MQKVCLDLETTGLSPDKDHVIEVAIVRFDETGILDRWTTLVKPAIQIPTFTTRLTGIDNEMVKDAPTLAEVRDTILEKLGDAPIVGHFIFFDVNFLQAKGFPVPNLQLDTCQLAQILLANEPSYSLEVLVNKLGIAQPGAHRAENDVLANIELYFKLLNHVKAMNADEKSALTGLMQKSTWPWAKTVLEALEQGGGERIIETPRIFTVSSEKHANLAALAPTAPFIFQEASHTTADLVDYAVALKEPSLLLVPDLREVPEHPDLGVLKNPQDYLSMERLEHFLSAEKLDTNKTLLAAKMLLYIKSNPTGEKSGVRLFKEETNAWFDICGQEDDPGTIYAAAKKAAENHKVLVMNHHSFLMSKALPKRPHWVIGDLEAMLHQVEQSWHLKVSEERLLAAVRQIRSENPEANQFLDELAGQISIFFGFMGMMVKRHGEANDFRHQLVVQSHHRNTLEWNKVVKSIQSIENTLTASGDTLKATASRDELELLVRTLRESLEVDGPILWISLSADETLLLHSFPENVAHVFEKKIWPNAGELHLFSHNGDQHDDFLFLKTELGLPFDFPTKNAGNAASMPLYYPEETLPSPNDPSNIAKVTQWLNGQLPNLEGDIFLLVSAKHTAEQFFYSLLRPTQAVERKLFVQNMGGGMGKIMKMAEATQGKNLYVGNDDFLSFLLSEGAKIKILVVHRLPFAHPEDPITKARVKDRGNVFQDYALPMAQIQNALLLHRFLGSAWEGKSIWMLDRRG